MSAFLLVALVIPSVTRADNHNSNFDSSAHATAINVIPVLDFRAALEAHLSDEQKACAVDTLRETLLQKHGSYIERLSTEEKEFCIQSLQRIEVLRCEKMFTLLGRQLSMLDSLLLSTEKSKSDFFSDKYSQMLTTKMIQEVQAIRGETIDRIDAVFNTTQCPLLRGFTGYFAKKSLKSNVNQKLDEQVNVLAATRFNFESL